MLRSSFSRLQSLCYKRTTNLKLYPLLCNLTICASKTNSPPTYYDILGIKSNATHNEIKEAYYSMSKKYHPDMNKGMERATSKFLEINDAFKILSNKAEKSKYDSELNSKLNPRKTERKPRKNFIYEHEEIYTYDAPCEYEEQEKEVKTYTAAQLHKHLRGIEKRKCRHKLQKLTFNKYMGSKLSAKIVVKQPIFKTYDLYNK